MPGSLRLRTMLAGAGGMMVLALGAAPASACEATIYTIAGHAPTPSFLGDFGGEGGLATLSLMNAPTGVVTAPGRGFVVADTQNNRIRQVTAAGRIGTLAGAGPSGRSDSDGELPTGYAGDGGPATEALLAFPQDAELTANGEWLIADTRNHAIRRVSPSGIITTVAGTGTPGLSGDGGPASSAALNEPVAVAATADGGFLVADGGNRRIRRVSPSGTITTVAGGGTSTEEGIPATTAMLGPPAGMAVVADGGFLVADRGRHRIWRVSNSGLIMSAAGSGTEGFAGDGGPATAAGLDEPTDVAVDPPGGFLIADAGNRRVRYVGPDGVIRTAAGAGRLSTRSSLDFAGDGGNALRARVAPVGVAVTPDGFLVADVDNHRIRFVHTRLGASRDASCPGAERLAVAFTRETYRSTPRRSLRLTVATTRASELRIDVIRGRERIDRLRRRLRAGRSFVRLGPLPRGRYDVRVVARGRGRKLAADTARVRILR